MSKKPKPQTQVKNALAEPKPTPAIIVFGLDQANKPRAASFTADQVELATKAAELMKLRVLKVAGPELTELAARLEAGRIYASGHGFVPPIRPNVYERLNELADPKPAPGLPRSWDEIDVGHMVLTYDETTVGWGWWHAIVVAKDSDMLTLKWRDYPYQAQVVRHRDSVALLKPTTPEPAIAA
jgi:hypothetical protein